MMTCMSTFVSRRYVREFLPAMAGYVAVLMLSVWALRHAESMALRVVLALAPVLPVGLAARALLRFVRDGDELQQRILLEAFALAALVLTLGSFSLGLLVSAEVIHIRAELALTLLLPAYAALYGLFAFRAARRYR